MNKRFTVRINVKTSRWLVWDSHKEKVIRSYPNASQISAESLCKYMNNTYEVVRA